MMTASRPGTSSSSLVVLEGLRALALELLDLVGAIGEMVAIDIAQGDDLDAAGLEGGLDIDHAVPAAADEAELDGGRSRAVGRTKKTGHCRGTRHGRTKKLPAIKRFHCSPPDCFVGFSSRDDIITDTPYCQFGEPTGVLILVWRNPPGPYNGTRIPIRSIERTRAKI